MTLFSKGFESRDRVLLLDGKSKGKKVLFKNSFIPHRCEQKGEEKPLWVLLNSGKRLNSGSLNSAVPAGLMTTQPPAQKLVSPGICVIIKAAAGQRHQLSAVQEDSSASLC